MKNLITLFCEGSDLKLIAFEKAKDKCRVMKTIALDLSVSSFEEESLTGLNIEGMLGDSTLGLGKTGEASMGSPNEGLINAELKDLKLEKYLFIPGISEPLIHFHVIESKKNLKSSKMVQEIADEILKSKNISVDKDSLAFTELAGDSLLAAFLEGEIPCIDMVNAIARLNGKRNYKIQAVKSAELSLAYYVAKKKSFLPDDNSLIIYIGKEYSKLIFLEGSKLKHIGSTLDVGVSNLHTYDVYFSKILLEMENGGIPRLDNVVICGEDDSENLVLSIYGTFPEANVSKLDFDEYDISAVPEEEREKLHSFVIPFAIAAEAFDEANKKYKGINLLPKYIREEQKILQFGWHSYLLMPIIFAATLYFTQVILRQNKELNGLNENINKLELLQKKNQRILDEITAYEGRIANFGSTQTLLDSAAKGSEIWWNITSGMSNFIGQRKNMWVTSITNDAADNITINGYAISRGVLTEFANSYENALLKNVVYEPLRKKNSYKYTINLSMSDMLRK